LCALLLSCGRSGPKIANAPSIIRLQNSFSCLALCRPRQPAQYLKFLTTEMPDRPKRVGKPTPKRQEQLMADTVESAPAKAPRRATHVPENHTDTQEVSFKKSRAVSTAQKVRVCEAQLRNKDFKEGWHAKASMLEAIMARKRAHKPLSTGEATMWEQFAQEAHPAWLLFPRKDDTSATYPPLICLDV
jgi:hypothetical protein